MLPTVTLVMMNLGFMVSGAILIETVFNWPGMGLLSYEAMRQRDYPVMQAVFLLGSVAVIVANLDRRHHVLLHRPTGEGMMPDAAS